MITNPDYYQERINKSLAYISANIGEEINIKRLAKEASFSQFHFQRIFKSIQGETPYEALLRLRLEKAVFMLRYEQKKRISDIAFECGFKSSENFSRQFKARFKHAPSKFRNDKVLQNSRIYHEESKEDFYPYIEKSRHKEKRAFKVTIDRLGKIPIAFIRAIFGQDGSILVQRYQQLIAWAEEIKVNYKGPLKRFGLSIDHPDVTPANKYRYDFALSIPEQVEVSGLIERGDIPKGLYATIHCQGKLSDVAQAWDHLYKIWLPKSSYVPRDYPAIEEFIQGPEEIGWENFNIKCRIPIQTIN